jgi:hypothetical protein
MGVSQAFFLAIFLPKVLNLVEIEPFKSICNRAFAPAVVSVNCYGGMAIGKVHFDR